MVPMAMLTIDEFIYLGNSAFINSDMRIDYLPQNMAAKADSTNLNNPAGQVEYISEKTGMVT